MHNPAHLLGLAFLLTAAVPAVAADRADLRLRHGSVMAEGPVLQTTAPESAAETRLAGNGLLRLVGVARARTTTPLQLERGQALLSSGKGFLGRQAVEGVAGPVLLSLRGTALLSAVPGQSVTIIVLEGTATARLKDRRSHFVELPAGAMLMVEEGGDQLPATAEMRLSRLCETSGLLGRPFGPLEASAGVSAAIARQEKELSNRRLVASNIRVRGSQASLGGGSEAGASRTAGGTSSTSGSAASGGSASSSAAAAGGGSGTTGAIFCVGCASRATPIGAVSASDPNRLAQIRAEKAAAGGTAAGSGPAVAGGRISPSVTATNTGSRGDLGQALPEESTISVRNSSDLNALAQAVILASFGENLTVESSSFSRQPGAINLDAGTIFGRTLTLRQSTFSADIIKARGFHTGGRDALLIDGGTFNASQIIRLYAEGGGTLRFRGDVVLNSPQTDLAGSAVQIDAGGRVRASGNVRVSSDDHRYDRAGFGTLEAAGTKTTQRFVERPGY